MTSLATTPLLAAGALTAVAALAHLACIAIGAPAYHWMGAGERMIRAVAFPWLKPLFPENSNRFWWVSSGICLLIGSLYGWGAAAL